ncbi:MAG TPA: hypothetical protein VFO60_11595, partial [Candidatus Dormibacteraeota bacterium]|nr:hypothetical protein [Candidatus Dormibacteraeota bacterium]
LVLATGVVLYVRRTTAGAGAQVAAVMLALFAMNPLTPFGHWTGLTGQLGVGALDDVASETFTVGAVWGYAPAAIATGLIPVLFLLVERSMDVMRGQAERRRAVAAAIAVGITLAWLHPWQGTVALASLLMLLVWTRGAGGTRVPLVALSVAAPLVYYFALSRLDGAWGEAAVANDIPLWGARIVVLGLVPLGLLAAVGGLPRGQLDVQARLVRIWPAATLCVYVLRPSFSNHVVEGVAIPLSILAVEGWRRITRSGPAPVARLAAVALVGLMIIPGAIENVSQYSRAVEARVLPYFLRPDEARALDWMAGEPGGGVLTGPFLAAVVPVLGGHDVWSGHPSWTPDFAARTGEDEELVSGRLDGAAVRALVVESGARFILTDCSDGIDLSARLAPILMSTHRFGCASVYEVGESHP